MSSHPFEILNSDCHFTEEGNLFATACYDGTVKLWQSTNSNLPEIKTILAHKSKVSKLVLEKHYLFTVGWDRCFHVYDRNINDCLVNEFFCNAPITALAVKSSVDNTMKFTLGDQIGNLYFLKLVQHQQ
jgi:WD40 repeat protein